MRRGARAWPPIVAALIACAAVLTGCAQSSNTTSPTSGGAGAAPPSSSTPSTPSTPSSPGPTTTTGSGTAAPPGGSGALAVTPAVGSPRSVIHFEVTLPYRTGPQGSLEIANALSVVGPQRPGCVGAHQEALPSLPTGQMAGVTVGPSQLGGPWCPGAYTARVEVVARPKCGPGQMCPQFVRLLAVLGPVRFRISG